MRRVVVTGLGAVTPIGNNVGEMWEAVKAGKCGIAPITHYDTEGRKVTVAGEVKDFDASCIDKKELRKMDRFSQFALVAANEALADSGLNLEKENPDRIGVIVASGIGGLGTIESDHTRGMEKGFDRVSPFFIPMSISNMAAARIAITYGLKGICSCVVTACAAGTNAVGDAYRNIKDGYSDILVCGGAEASITTFGIGGFTALQALSTSSDPNRASIPFDKERSGFVMGEGAGILVLEEYEHAKARGAKIYCEIAGYGTNCDAHHVTAPLEDGSGAAKCMQLAMESAGITPDDVQYINAHGTSTQLNEKGETQAVKLAFKDAAKKVAVSSTKSMTGHLLGASGGVEAIITTLAVKNDFAPATINYKVPDENCDLDVIPNEGRNMKINYALSNSFGFGGHNATVVFKKI